MPKLTAGRANVGPFVTDNSTPDSNTYQPPTPPPAHGTNGLAIASLVLSIVNLFGLGSLLAIILGHVSLGQIKRQPQGGRGLAIAGTILGHIGVVAAAAVGITVIIAASKLDDYEPF